MYPRISIVNWIRFIDLKPKQYYKSRENTYIERLKQTWKVIQRNRQSKRSGGKIRNRRNSNTRSTTTRPSPTRHAKESQPQAWRRNNRKSGRGNTLAINTNSYPQKEWWGETSVGYENINFTKRSISTKTSTTIPTVDEILRQMQGAKFFLPK